jgi:hypothetical protein
MVSPLLAWHPSGIEPTGVADNARGWQVPPASSVPVQTTPPSWPLAVASAAKLTAPIRREARRRPAMIAPAAACFTVILAVPTARCVEFTGSNVLLMFSSFISASDYLFEQVLWS